MGTRYHINLKVRTGPYVQAVDGVVDFRQLEETIVRKILLIQGVDIKGDVDTHDAAETEIRFKQCVQSALDKYSKQFRTIGALEYHFLPNQYEVHFNMIVDPEITVGEAHEITNLIEKDIYSKFQSAQVIIHIEPAVQ